MDVPYGIKTCAVREFTADGESVGRCFHYLRDGVMCPRHGNVADVQRRYAETGKLTNETELTKRTTNEVK